MNKSAIIFGSAVAAIVISCPCQAGNRQNAQEALNQFINLVNSGLALAEQGIYSQHTGLATAKLGRLTNQLQAVADYVRNNNLGAEFAELFIQNHDTIQQLRQAREQMLHRVANRMDFGLSMYWTQFHLLAGRIEHSAYAIYGQGQ